MLAVIYHNNGIYISLLLLRVVIGVTMLAHGYNHIWGGGKIEGTARWFESLGMKPGIVHAWLASLTELGVRGAAHPRVPHAARPPPGWSA